MRIGVNALSVVPGVTGGGETYLTGLLRALAELDMGHRYTLFLSSRHQEALGGIPPEFDCIVCEFARSRVRRVAFERFHLPRLVEKAGVDILFSPGNVAAPVQTCAQVVCVQSLLYRLAPREVSLARRMYFAWAMPRSVRCADMVIAVSEDARRQVLALGGVSEEKVRVVHEGVDSSFHPLPPQDIERGLARWGLMPGYILFVSGLKPYKNADKLIRACAANSGECAPKESLVIAGPDRTGLTPSLRGLAEKLGIAERVKFLGVIEREWLPALYAGASVFAFPSAIETFGLPVLEAMGCGTPVVASNRFAVPEVVGGAGLIADPDDVPAFSKAIRRAQTDEALRNTLRRKGLERASLFTWRRAAEETLPVLEEAHRRWKGR